jgi:hypothetical protein
MSKKPIIILQYDLEGNFLREWDIPQTHIAEKLNIDHSDLNRAVLNKMETAGGFQWRVSDRGRTPSKISQAYEVYAGMREVPVKKYYQGRFICVYNSMQEAAYKNRIDISNVSRVVSGEERDINGFTFERLC